MKFFSNKINFSNNFKSNITNLCAVFIAIFLFIYLFDNFPDINQYYKQADEGIYFGFAQDIKSGGLEKYQLNIDRYANNKNLWDRPTPIRVGYSLFSAVFLNFSESYTSISVISALSVCLIFLLTFSFLKKSKDLLFSIFAASLVTFSPLVLGLGIRALSDVPAYLFVVLSFFAFFEFVKGNSKYGLMFILSISIAILIREMSILLLPFWSIFIFFESTIAFKKRLVFAICIILVPMLICGLIYWFTLGSLENALKMLNILFSTNFGEPSDYMLRYSKGPWFQNFIDFQIYSPIIFILFCMSIGQFRFWLGEKKSLFQYSLLYTFYILFIYAFMPKIIRYAVAADLGIRLCASVFIYEIVSTIKWHTINKYSKYFASVLILILIVFDISRFYKFHVKAKIYDPTSYNLLLAENFFNLSTYLPNENGFLNNSLEHYSKKKYSEAIHLVNKVIEINPNSAKAHNLKCACLNNLNQYTSAIVECKKALSIDPNFQLAKNNLNWSLKNIKN